MESGKPPVAPSPEAPVFAAVIRPHRSLGREGLRLVLTLCCLATVAASVPFIVLGAWPVAGFFGLDLVALALAFRINRRDAEAREEVVVTPVALTVRQVSARGRAREWRFNPLWARLHRQHDEEFGLLALTLTHRGERVAVAGALSPAEREDFADAFGRALAEVKRRI
jgi:uncharacterized membrane protein